MIMVMPMTVAAASAGAARQVPRAGTGSPQTGEYTPSGAAATSPMRSSPGGRRRVRPDAYTGNIVDRSLSSGGGHGASVNSGAKAKSNRNSISASKASTSISSVMARGNQFTVEPPDQGLCVGHGFVLEAVNDVLNIPTNGRCCRGIGRPTTPDTVVDVEDVVDRLEHETVADAQALVRRLDSELVAAARITLLIEVEAFEAEIELRVRLGLRAAVDRGAVTATDDRLRSTMFPVYASGRTRRRPPRRTPHR